MNKGQQFTFVGSIVLLASAFLPWISVIDLFGEIAAGYEGIERGWEGDGFITGGIGLILLLVSLLVRGAPGKRYSLIGAILALIAGQVVILDFWRIAGIGPATGFFAATGIGLYTTLIGALLALIGSLWVIPHRTDLPSGNASPAPAGPAG